MADSNPPADQTAASNDLPDAPLSHDQAIGMVQAHVVAASEHLKHAAGYLSDSGYSPDEDARDDAAETEPDADEQGGPPDSDADEQGRSVRVGDATVTPLTPLAYEAGQLAQLAGQVATVTPDEEKPAARGFPGSAQQRRGYAPGSVNQRTAAAMRGRP